MDGLLDWVGVGGHVSIYYGCPFTPRTTLLQRVVGGGENIKSEKYSCKGRPPRRTDRKSYGQRVETDVNKRKKFRYSEK
jgi:hypothetical protein